jgi:hypothetical protein
MVRLTEDDSVPRVEDATERHMRLCAQTAGGEKYQKEIEPYYDALEVKITEHKTAQKNNTGALDIERLNKSILNDCLRDLQGRSKEFDRNHPGSNTVTFLFPDGNISSVVNLSDSDAPKEVHSITQKIISLGADHTLYPFAAQIETLIGKCKISLTNRETLAQAESDANTELVISKIALVNKYNGDFFVAASDVDKNFAEKLYPKLNPPAKSKDNPTTKS